MTETRPSLVLLEICDLVESEVAASAASLPGRSFFADELNAIQRPDRREFLKNYICESMIALMLGVLDQARCMALTLDRPGVAVGPFMLMRGLLEYSYKIAFIADPCISPSERISRSLKLYSTDMRQLQKMFPAKDIGPAGQYAANNRELAGCWYREVTGEKLNTVSAESIMDSVWKAGVEGVEKEDLVQNEVYEIGYRAGSAVMHGHTWAIRLFCLENRTNAEGEINVTRLRDPHLLGMLILAARVLQSSVAFFVQLGGKPPAAIKNRLEKRIHELEALLAAYQPD